MSEHDDDNDAVTASAGASARASAGTSKIISSKHGLADEEQARARFASAYRAGYERYLADGGEAALVQAFDVGREAMAGGFGMFELVAIHDDVVTALGDGRSTGGSVGRTVSRGAGGTSPAQQYFAEAVAPFEMALRGYQASNLRLGEVNALLQLQNAELQEAQREAIAANRELEAFSSRAAHDLRSPLTVVDGFAQLLLDDDTPLGPGERVWAREIRGAVAHMLGLIHELLQLARAGGSEMVREDVDVTELARVVVARLQAAQRSSEPDRCVEVVIAEGLRTRADPRLLVIVLENLIGNAWKFTGRTAQALIEVGVVSLGDLSAGTGTAGRGVANVDAFCVRDNGAGFDAAQAAQLFAPFQRLHSSAEFEGTGIGLATVQRILQRHQGTIWAEAAVGRGAAFYFTTGPAPTTSRTSSGSEGDAPWARPGKASASPSKARRAPRRAPPGGKRPKQ